MSARARSVVLVGRGRMGGAFARAFRAAGVAHRVVPGRALRDPRTSLRRPSGAVTWILAVTDAAVAETAEQLASRGLLHRGDVVVHLAGMLGPEALAAARAQGAAVAAVHPLVAVATPRQPPPLSRGVASFEGDARALPAVRAFARPIGMAVHPLDRVERTRYHAAAALVATGAIALAQGAEGLFRAAAGAGVDERAVRAFVGSLLASAAHNVEVAGPAAALASPLMRGDTRTVARHLERMAVEPRARALYAAALAQVLTTLARTGAVDAEVIERAQALLGPASPG